MKRITSIILVFVMIFSLSSCHWADRRSTDDNVSLEAEKSGSRETTKPTQTTRHTGSDSSSETDEGTDVIVTDEMVDRAAAVLNDLSSFLEIIPEKIEAGSESEEGWVDSSMTPEERVSSVIDFLNEQRDVADVWQENDTTVGFTTTDRIFCSYTVRQVNDDPELNYAGPAATTDANTDPSDEELLDVFNVVYDFRGAPVDPDVLVMAPLHTEFYDRKANGSDAVGKKLAKFTKGEYLFADNSDDSAQVMNLIHNGKLCDYGTVMLITHGGVWSRGDGTEYVSFTAFSSTDAKNAGEAWNRFIRGFDDAQSIQNCLRSPTDEDRASHPQALLIFGVQEIFKNCTDFIKWAEKTEYKISITTNYIMKQYSDRVFPGTLFYLGACNSGRDVTFNRFLTESGASAVVGFSHSVYVLAEQSICKALFTNLMKKSSAAKRQGEIRTKNVEESIEEGYSMVMEDLAGIADWRKSLEGEETSIWPQMSGHTGFVYQGTGEIKGQVTSYDGVAMEGCVVSVWRYYDDKLSKTGSAVTDNNGGYSIPDAPYGMYLMRVQKDATEMWKSFGFAESVYEMNIWLMHTFDYYQNETSSNAQTPSGEPASESESESAAGGKLSEEDIRRWIPFLIPLAYSIADDCPGLVLTQNDARQIIRDDTASVLNWYLDPFVGESADERYVFNAAVTGAWKIDSDGLAESLKNLLDFEVDYDRIPAELYENGGNYLLVNDSDGLFLCHTARGKLPYADCVNVKMDLADNKAVLKADIIGEPQLSASPTGSLYITLIPASNSYGFTVESIQIRSGSTETELTEGMVLPWADRIIDLAFAVTGTVTGQVFTRAEAAAAFGDASRKVLYRFAFSLLQERMEGNYGGYVVWKLNDLQLIQDTKNLLGVDVYLNQLPTRIPDGYSDYYVLFYDDYCLYFGHQPMGLPTYAELNDYEFRNGKAFLRAAYYADPYSKTPSGYLYVTLIPAENLFGFTIEYIETRTQ